MLGHKRGEHDVQQGFEALALLVAIRLDNSFPRFSACKGRYGQINTVARDCALDIGEFAFSSGLVQHIPGVTNMVADSLSRRTDPKYASTWALSHFLVNAKVVIPPLRTTSWWRALSTTVVASVQVWGRISSCISSSAPVLNSGV